MELLALDSNFRPQTPIDTFLTAIWTERYSKVGDLQIFAEPTPKMRALLAEGTFIGCVESDEVAQIDTFLVEDGVLKVTGNMITDILDDRILRDVPSANREYTITGVPEEVMKLLVERVVVAGGSLTTIIPDGPLQIIPNLTIDKAVVYNGSAVQFAVPYGSLLAGLQQIADSYSVGFKIYLESVSETSYSLKFKAYRGRYLTSDQSTYPVVKFSPAMDTLTDLKTLRSIAEFKTAAYVYGSDDGTHPPPGIAYAPSGGGAGFDRRVIMVDAADITMELAGGNTSTFNQMLTQRAKDTLANNNYTKVIDGEIVPQSEFQYGIHFLLGDVVELDGGDGITSKARITEYIRTQDESGERAYPTVSVLE